MISLSPQSKIFVAIECVDFRKGISGLKAVCRQKLELNPDSGVIFLFRNRRMTSIKILAYDGQGFWLMNKRLSRGRFPWWPMGEGKGRELDYRQFQLLINGAFRQAEFVEDWKSIS